MITLAQCAAYSGLASNEAVGGAAPSARHRQILSSYLLNLHRGAVAVREMITRDLRCFLDLGAKRRAADLVVVLCLFLSDFPEARTTPLEKSAAGVIPPRLSRHHRCSEYDRCFAPLG
jgi:hypothetical protein